mmetsp:Transcript_23698/g.45147  ORF Transcript_23698/g.45147 Transcript_23698/m.45147 type:complete len:93 (+) Transcript_23698:1220-1498(+)
MPPSVRNEEHIPWASGTFQRSPAYIRIRPTFDMGVPKSQKPFADRYGHTYVISRGGWENSGRSDAGRVEYPSFATNNGSVPCVGAVWINVKA